MEYVINSYHSQRFIDVSLIIHKNSHYALYSSGRRTARPEARARALKGRLLHSPSDFTQHSYEASWFIRMGLRINTREKKQTVFPGVERSRWKHTGLEKIRLPKPKTEQQAGGSLSGHLLMACRGWGGSSSSQSSPEWKGRTGSLQWSFPLLRIRSVTCERPAAEGDEQADGRCTDNHQ